MITFDGEWGLAMRLRGTPVFPENIRCWAVFRTIGLIHAVWA